MIATELHELSAAWPLGSWSWSIRMTNAALDFCIEVAASMGLEREFLSGPMVDVDVLSEAIQFAEALGV